MPRLARQATERLISDDVLLTQLSTLDELVLLVPDQVAMILGRSKETLKEERDQGRPPPHVKTSEKGAYYYRLGDVRDYLRVLQTFITDEERAVYFKKHNINGLDEIRPLMELRNKRYQEQARLDAAGKRTMGFTSIGDFLTRALPDDEWPFTVVDGKPIDFFTSLGLGAENLPEDGVECGWLSLDEYLVMRRDSALLERQQREAAELRAVADEANPEALPTYQRPVMGGKSGGRL
ncbi:MAG: hypothetical protein ACTHKH_06875 [Trinickia sp.]